MSRRKLRHSALRSGVLVGRCLLTWALLTQTEAAAQGGGLWEEQHLAFVTDPYGYAFYGSAIQEGPALQVMGSASRLALGAQGEMYFTNERGTDVYLLRDGQIRHLAGTSRRGFRDGPAALAMFNPGGRGYAYFDIACDKRTGALYVADGGNERIRKIEKDSSGNWTVSTFAGGGTEKLTEGEVKDARAIDLGTVVAVTVDDEGNVFTSPHGQLVKITPGGEASVTLVFPEDGYPRFTNVVDLDADAQGSIFGVTRANLDGYFKVSKDGTFTRLTFAARSTGSAIDGPIEEATFFCPTNVAVSPDGTAVYGVGGDEFCLRKIDLTTRRVSTLQEDGTWREVQVRCQGSASSNAGWVLGAARAVEQDGSIIVGPAQKTGLKLRRLKRLK